MLTGMVGFASAGNGDVFKKKSTKKNESKGIPYLFICQVTSYGNGGIECVKTKASTTSEQDACDNISKEPCDNDRQEYEMQKKVDSITNYAKF